MPARRQEAICTFEAPRRGGRVRRPGSTPA